MPVETVGNEIRVRVEEPESFDQDSFRRITISKSQGIDAIIGKKIGSDKTTVQAFRFDKQKWTEASAKTWVEDHGYTIKSVDICAKKIIENFETDYSKKTFEISDFKVVEEDSGKIYITGYANTKNKPDSYGDIPTNFNGQPVYDLSRFLKNPVFLIDHYASVGNIAGNFVELVEDDVGLRFKLLLMPIEKCFTDSVKHAVSAFKEGFARALSIGGKWFYDDPQNPSHLTRAYIYEISGVAIPADQDALCYTQRPKSIENGLQLVVKTKAEQVSIEKKLNELNKLIKERKKC